MNQTPPPSPFSSAPIPERPRGWWSRNWKWVVPSGCLGLIAVVIVFVAAIFLIVFGALKSTDVYKTAVARAKSSPAVIEALGAPIEEGWFMSGKTNVEGTSGEADIGIPISGPKGKGTIYAVATKSAGRWSYTTLEVEVSGRAARIDLLGDEKTLEQ
ncbi:MAG TPA: cytochrome c oxidase assembly factor Coa1 family protein [Chthoniobacterales bacterium]